MIILVHNVHWRSDVRLKLYRKNVHVHSEYSRISRKDLSRLIINAAGKKKKHNLTNIRKTKMLSTQI